MDETSGQGQSSAGGDTTSVISAEVSITGKLTSDGAVHVDGQVDGAVVCRALKVGAGGHLKGEVECDEVTVEGQVDGNIRARQVYLGESAQVRGDIEHSALDILPGAYFEGRVSRRSADKKVAQQAPA